MKRKYSLKKNYEIEKVLKTKKSVGNKYYAIYYMPNKLTIPQIAISVSKKFGNAVKRNYQKRVVREILRKLIKSLPNYSYLIVVKKKVEELSFFEKENQLIYLLKKIERQEKGVLDEKYK